MKQRLAVARALAFGPRLLFYDEPTSGLDPAMSLEVARRIREAHDHHGMTSLVVTHDLLSLKDIADRIILLDPREKRLREVPKADVDRALSELAGFRAPEPPEQPPLPWGARMLDAVRRGTMRFLDGTGTFVLGAARTCVHLVPRYPATRWGLRFLWHFIRLGTLGTAIPFIALAGLIAGFITTFFMFGLLPLQGYTEPVLVEEFIGSLGYALYRVVVPVVTTLLFASRTGAAIAADIGNRVLTRQVDAMRSHGIPPSRYLLTGLGLSCLAGIPLLFFLSYETARLAAVAVFLATHPGHGPFAFNQEFLSLVGEGWGPFPGGTGYVLGKLLISALGTAGIAYHVGMRPKASGAAVASGVTSAIIRTTVFVLTVHLVFALFEF
jgi:ABC-type transporter Mla maintaining outer membrane lipid asymmetry permease subunit MlaE